MKAIIFDCDGVLVDSEILYLEIDRRELSRIGLDYEYNLFVSTFMGTGEKHFFSVVSEHYQEKFAKPIPDHFREYLLKLHETEFRERLQLVEGMAELITAIKKPKAVASSSRLNFLKEKMRQTGIIDMFGDHIYSAEQVAHAKPFPDLFLFTAKNLGVAPEDCIVIEDSANGVKAGKAAGMHTIGFCGGGHCDAAHGESLKEAGADDVAMDVYKLSSFLV